MSDLGRDRHYDVPSGVVARGSVLPPGSKSLSHRFLNLALLHQLPLEVRNLLEAEDLDLFRAALDSMGWGVSHQDGVLVLDPPVTPSTGGRVFCGNAGTMLRFLTATLCVVPGRWELDGTPRMRERPIAQLVEALRQLGAEVVSLGQEGYVPVELHGGSLSSGRCSLDASSSSQYLSALLMAGSVLDAGLEIEVTSLASAPYVDLTLQAMTELGCATVDVDGGLWRVVPTGERSGSRRSIVVESDFSAVAYPAAAACITGGEVEIRGVGADSLQGDRRFLDVLEKLGATVSWHDGAVVVSGRPESALDVDLGAMPDQVPTLAAVAAFCPGTTRIRGVAHLRIKESDRLRAMSRELERCGVVVRELDDGLEIEGRPEWLEPGEAPNEPVEIETYDDHRIAMSMALVGLRRGGVRILEPHVVGKSYPGFWRDLDYLVRGRDV